MHRLVTQLAIVILATTVASSRATTETSTAPEAEPLETTLEESVGVHLVLIDALVLDGKDRTVGGLTIDDFEVTLEGERVPIDTLDVSCGEGGVTDPRGVGDLRRRAGAAGGDDEVGRRIVLVLDYQHLPGMQRVQVLEQARGMMAAATEPNDEIMVAALTGGVRVEQAFTRDHATVAETLKRMEYDITLWAPGFQHLSEDGFFHGLEVLLHVLDRVPGKKAMVLFSSSPAAADENDLRFAELAAQAAASRCSIYPVHARGLVAQPPG